MTTQAPPPPKPIIETLARVLARAALRKAKQISR